MMIRFVFSLLLLSCIVGIKAQNKEKASYPIIPYPSSLQATKGEFAILPSTIIISGEVFRNEALILQQLLENASGSEVRIASKIESSLHSIFLKTDNSIIAEEGYIISIRPDKIELSAKSPVGMFRAVQTIRQLLPVTAETKAKQVRKAMLPALDIQDEPAYSWRGMHLDVSRHFFSIAYLKKFIDVMALYKMNKLHLHLTDDQGWRIEIKRYPKLTEQGAWRTFNAQDSFCMKKAAGNPDMALDKTHIIQKDGKTLYGGFYTQKQMKEFVAYAASKYVEIIPEIDMPGHMMEAIHAYPYLSSDGNSKWGENFSTPICPCKESTFEFAENVFTEIMDIFPSKYIHLGADEVDRKTWSKSIECTNLMQKEGITDVAALQSYFVKRMEAFFISKGKQLIGWDEILEGGASSTAYIMYWRSWVKDAPLKASKNGNYIIMTPNDPLYFDYPPDAHSLDNIYHFNILPKDLNADEAKYIIGAQANLWTEQVPSENRADYLYLPRMTALAEKVWSKKLDYESYLQRLNVHFVRLGAMNIHYRLPDIDGAVAQNVFTDTAILDLKPAFSGLKLHYTTNGNLPVKTSATLDKPLFISKPVTIKLAAFTENGLRGDIYTLDYKKEAFSEALQPKVTTAGLQCSYYKKYFRNIGEISAQQADSNFEVSNITVPTTINAPSFGLAYNGYIDVPETGIYTFYFLCDDGGILNIANKEVVNNDGQHAPIEKIGQIALKKGIHQFKLDFIEGGGGFKLGLKYSFNKGAIQELPAKWFKH